MTRAEQILERLEEIDAELVALRESRGMFDGLLEEVGLISHRRTELAVERRRLQREYDGLPNSAKMVP
ncbi:MAG TPA: hypothetical protein VLX09_04375 [Stellaceae bacterium]|nr:hypothetical protein [Stellaceae bacterium]